MSDELPTKAVVTVAEMARMCNLSRARFYQLQKAGIFPTPLYDVSTRRPFYDQELQKVCLEVRRRNCGVNGKPVLFYARRPGLRANTSKPKKATVEKSNLVEGLKSLGLTTVTAAQVGSALGELFPCGTTGVAEAEVLRSVFLVLRRRDSSGNVG
jgi:hypothetical protein